MNINKALKNIKKRKETMDGKKELFDLREIPTIEKKPYDFGNVKTISESTNIPQMRGNDNLGKTKTNYDRFPQIHNLAWY